MLVEKMDLTAIRDVVTILASVGTLLVAIITFYNSEIHAGN